MAPNPPIGKKNNEDLVQFNHPIPREDRDQFNVSAMLHGGRGKAILKLVRLFNADPSILEQMGEQEVLDDTESARLEVVEQDFFRPVMSTAVGFIDFTYDRLKDAFRNLSYVDSIIALVPDFHEFLTDENYNLLLNRLAQAGKTTVIITNHYQHSPTSPVEAFHAPVVREFFQALKSIQPAGKCLIGSNPSLSGAGLALCDDLALIPGDSGQEPLMVVKSDSLLGRRAHVAIDFIPTLETFRYWFGHLPAGEKWPQNWRYSPSFADVREDGSVEYPDNAI